jgi:protein-disulfide isomerase
MATGPQQKRKDLRDKRLKAEAQSEGSDRRQNMSKIVGIAAFLAVIAVAAIVIVSQSGSDEPSKESGDVDKLLAGIPQDGSVLGDPDAPVTLVEFADLQCPACQAASETIIPDVISGPVKSGKASYEFNNWAILGPDSTTAAKAALAASEQNLMQQYVENFYADQGTENSGYVTDDFLKDIAEKAGIPDMDKWEADRDLPKWDQVLLEVDNQAIDSSFTGTPTFAIKNADGSLDQIDARSADDIIRAINQAQ